MRAIIFKYITTRPILTDSFVKSTFFSFTDCEGKEQNSNKSQRNQTHHMYRKHPPVQFKMKLHLETYPKEEIILETHYVQKAGKL